MTEQQPPTGRREVGLIEIALIIALVAVVIIGVLVVLAPAIAQIAHTIQQGG